VITYPTYAKPVPLDTILRARNFTGMHPTMQERVRALLEASKGRVGWGQGMRTAQQQLQLFLQRHTPDPNGRFELNGQRFSRLPGQAPAAPPGISMHEIGLAADLVGDFDWLTQNAASFGLRTFAEVNREPWHVQPAELPKGRTQYEKQDSPWGAHPTYRSPSSSGSTRFVRSGTGGTAPGTGGAAAGAGTGTSGAGTTATKTTTKTATPAAVPTLTPALVARPGDTGPAARVLMEALVARGLLPDVPGSRDTSYSAPDRTVVEAFQREHGLHVDGEVGPQTWGALLAPVRPGDTGPMVRVLQTVLIVRSLIRDNAANLDGRYLEITQQRVKDFQAASGIDAVGVVGPETWTALLGVKKKVVLATRGIDEEGEAAPAPAAPVDEVDLDDLDLVAALGGMAAE
jgi:peptidoglycan hydrolase-like protein with peptidoglycan-binding domain